MIVTTAQGRLEGLELDGLQHFRGIPYAASPVGERRFLPPAEPESWDGVRAANEFGPASCQSSGGITAMLGDQASSIEEDCLFLNVTTPACDGLARPVMVWIHGGGFVNGSGSTPWYDGTSLAARGDVVVVTINYRLGALGFLWLGDLDPRYRASGMNGILDQVAALRWVRDNIAEFGGDPENVTVFGESAGAMSIGTLLATPAARGLFHRAVAQSGAADNVLSPSVAAGVTADLLGRLGVTTIEGLLAAPADRITDVAAEVEGRLHQDPSRLAGRTGIARAMAFQPVVDGEWLPEDPEVAVASGRAIDVPLLIGTNRDEWNLFRLMSPGGLDHPELLDRLERIFGDGHRVHDTYAQEHPAATIDDLWSAVLTDATFRIPAIRLVEARIAASSPTFQYLFTWATPALGGVVGSCHALEIPFVFGVLDNPGAEFLLGATDAPELRRLSERMQDAWLAFARTGDPNTAGLPHWPAADIATRPVMRFDLASELVADPGAATRVLWEGVGHD